MSGKSRESLFFKQKINSNFNLHLVFEDHIYFEILNWIHDAYLAKL